MLSQASPKTVTVQYRTGNGSAVAPSDYVSKTGTVTFAPGQRSKAISVSIRRDRMREPNEVFFVFLHTAKNARLIDPNASGGILNDN